MIIASHQDNTPFFHHRTVAIMVQMSDSLYQKLSILIPELQGCGKENFFKLFQGCTFGHGRLVRGRLADSSTMRGVALNSNLLCRLAKRPQLGKEDSSNQLCVFLTTSPAGTRFDRDITKQEVSGAYCPELLLHDQQPLEFTGSSCFN